MARRRLTHAEIDTQTAGARASEAQERKAGLRARSARYDHDSELVVLELTNGYLFGFDPRRFKRLKLATPKILASVEVSPSGEGLHWEAVDEDLSVPNLLYNAIGRGIAFQEFARAGGQSRSEAKAAAARVNGAKGGRPRKKPRPAK
jgi:hypothetical protein